MFGDKKANDRLRLRVEELTSQLAAYELGWKPGHFYSPIPDLSHVRSCEDKIFRLPLELPGIDLRADAQACVAKVIESFYPEHPFQDTKQDDLRFYFDNPNYSYGEALALYGLLRHLKPKRMIEIGSGHSSCAILDTNEFFLNWSVDCTFIEPYPDLLHTLMKPGDASRVTVIAERLQDVDRSIFGELGPNDILFIDSTHVSKIDSDVNHLVFNILPSLKHGVYIHVHDIPYPFEYPKAWIYQGRAWNECYIMRAFLQYNPAFQIEFFNSWVGQLRRDLLQRMPLFLKNPGTSLWMQKQ